MNGHILVPLGHSRDAEAVLPYLRRLVRLGASEVTLLRTEMPVSMDPYTVVSDAVLVHARRYLNEVKGRLSEIRVHVRALARIGPPAETILEIAREKEVSMILLSGSGKAPLSRLLFGSVPERVIQKSGVPVLVIPPPRPDDSPSPLPPEIRPVENLLVPVDGGEGSMAVLPKALDLAQVLNSRLVLLRVLPTRDEPGCAGHEIFEVAEEQLYRAGERCMRAGVDFSVLIERGKPAERILAACRDRRIDWIAMATSGKSGLFTRTVARKVLRGTRLPLLTIRSDAAIPLFA